MFRNNQPSTLWRLFSKYKIQALVLFVVFLYLTSFLSYTSTEGNNNNNNNKKTPVVDNKTNNNKNNNNNVINKVTKVPVDYRNEHVDGQAVNIEETRGSEEGTGKQQEPPRKHGVRDEADPNHQKDHHTGSEINIPINDGSSFDTMTANGGNMGGMEQENNVKLPHDVTIVILGYTLHKDGMPSRILKERVELAVETYSRLKENDNLNPIIVLSGKSKPNDFDETEAEYKTEADAMRDIITTTYDIDERDIYMDLRATNTAENANNTLTMMLAKNIVRCIIITSDFHLLRSQYTFQTVFPAQIDLEFYGAETSEKMRKTMGTSERALFESSQKDLMNMGIIETDVVGYHPFRNVPRWRMIEREIELDARMKRDIGKHPLCVDYGSNQGYFSTSLAQKLPHSRIMSLEGEKTQEYKSAATIHQETLDELNIKNDFICNTTVRPFMFMELVSQNHVYEYQLCLSIFHWFGMKNREEFDKVLFDFLLNSKTSFLELPESMVYVGPHGHGQHEWQRVNRWYEGRSEEVILEDIRTKYNLNMSWKVLGAIRHDNGTIRKMIRVDVNPKQDTRDPLPFEDLKSIYQCYVNPKK
ncbi:hypothetical protein DFA_11531 [Cavenderia fasciculata]|uniref:DUF218 domain-containing protein n=1 Tax=Cavenderia fasciculata TaxID=261658 RepID=F4QDE2_CACFS|nr:uncharacterized protein DFA_11531 [Cavenderia fasciculata]EGG13770.1 hypothetical protein DFA_11531 [Cavenderia fasciculata]|eukprot:XP_004350478.1 hypothetical protein DFA_11531 [Cavenderia fasciculata]